MNPRSRRKHRLLRISRRGTIIRHKSTTPSGTTHTVRESYLPADYVCRNPDDTPRRLEADRRHAARDDINTALSDLYGWGETGDRTPYPWVCGFPPPRPGQITHTTIGRRK